MSVCLWFCVIRGTHNRMDWRLLVKKCIAKIVKLRSLFLCGKFGYFCQVLIIFWVLAKKTGSLRFFVRAKQPNVNSGGGSRGKVYTGLWRWLLAFFSYFFLFSSICWLLMFLVLALLFAYLERFSVSCMQDFFLIRSNQSDQRNFYFNFYSYGLSISLGKEEWDGGKETGHH